MTNISDITVKTIDGAEKSLGDYKGKVLLIVNVASQWGLTPQYSGLEDLYKTFKDEGLAVLGFPCNDFGNQEPGTEQEIKTFCETKFGVTFDLFSKVHAKGANQHPLYARLTSYEAKGDISWNFEKFVIDKGGNVVARFSPPTPPNDDKVVSKIQEELAR